MCVYVVNPHTQLKVDSGGVVDGGGARCTSAKTDWFSYACATAVRPDIVFYNKIRAFQRLLFQPWVELWRTNY